jgi:hypothetical protein
MSNNILAETYYTLYIRVISFFSGVLLAHIFDQPKEFSPFGSRKVGEI